MSSVRGTQQPVALKGGWRYRGRATGRSQRVGHAEQVLTFSFRARPQHWGDAPREIHKVCEAMDVAPKVLLPAVREILGDHQDIAVHILDGPVPAKRH